MARIFALADLHLSLSGAKPMEIFGELWRDHPRRMAEAWDERVETADTVLLPGDLSWARSLEEARPDLEWIGARPGSKLMLRGNHDGWWTGIARLRAALPPGCSALHNDSHRVGDWVVIGARGWTESGDPSARPGDGEVFARELSRLKLSVDHADRTFGRTLQRLALLHYPPWIEGRPPSPVVDILLEAGARHAIYGHLHGEDHRLAVRGERAGIHFHFVAADAVGFAPVELEL